MAVELCGCLLSPVYGDASTPELTKSSVSIFFITLVEG
jgi:hypothetical protein